MSTEFAKSQTCLNLMRAFAGESQARNRYTMAAGTAKAQGFHVLEQLFLFTAQQELAHAKVFYRHLTQLSGRTLTVDGTYPVDLPNDSLALLRAAQHNELQEWEHDYPGFGRIARQEGFDLIGKQFETIADIERTHAERFGRFADLLERGELFCAPQPVRWVCLHCGHVVEATMAPAHCDVCHHVQGYFLREDAKLL